MGKKRAIASSPPALPRLNNQSASSGLKPDLSLKNLTMMCWLLGFWQMSTHQAMRHRLEHKVGLFRPAKIAVPKRHLTVEQVPVVTKREEIGEVTEARRKSGSFGSYPPR